MNQNNIATEEADIQFLRNYLQNKFKKSFFGGLSVEEDYQYITDTQTKYPNNPSALIAQGYLEWRFGNKANGEILFEKAYQIAKNTNYNLQWFEIGVNTFLGSFYDTQLIESKPVLPDFQHLHIAPNKHKHPIILAACDNDYFEKFGRSFINICLKHSRGVVHIHVINPDENTMLFFERRKGDRLSFSIEKTEKTYRAYYATSRFLIAPFILNTYDVDVLVIDIDQAVSRNINGVLKGLSNDTADIFVPTLSNSWMPWNYRLATNVYLRNNQNVKKFLSFFSNYVNQAVERLGSYQNAWFIDQNAMYQAVAYLLNNRLGQVGHIQEYGRTAIGPDGLKKEEFSKLLAIYERNINFRGRTKVTDETKFASTLALLLKNKELALMFLDSFYNVTN